MTSSPSDSAPAPAVLGLLGSSVHATPLIRICSSAEVSRSEACDAPGIAERHQARVDGHVQRESLL